MSSYSIKITGDDDFIKALGKISNARYEGIVKKQIVQMLNRARQRGRGGTPFKTGELRKSSRADEDTMGYTKSYAPHVEFGHRTRGGGFVEGRHFLRDNVDAQNKTFQKDIRNYLKSLAE